MTEPRGPENPGGRRRLRDSDNPGGPADGPRRRRTPPPSGSHELPPAGARGRRAAPDPADAPPPQTGRRRRREDAPAPQAPPSAPPPATGRRRRREPADAPPPPPPRADLPPASGEPRHGEVPPAGPRGGDLPQPTGHARHGDPYQDSDEVPPPPPPGPPAAPRRRRRADPGDVPPAPPRRRPRSDTGDLPLPGDPGPARPVRRPGPPDGSMPPDPRFARPADGSMPPDPRFAGPVDGSMPRDPRFAGPVDGSMPPDPRFAGPVDGSMPPDPRFAGPVDGSMPPDPRFAGPVDGSMPPDPRLGRLALGDQPQPGPRRRRPPPVEHPTDVIPAVPDAAPREQIDDLFGEDDDYEDEYREDADYDQAYDSEAYDEDGYEDGDYEDEDYAEEPAPAKKKRKRSKRALGWVAALLVLVVFAGGAYYGYQRIFGYDDYDGGGEGSALIQVEDGDTTSAIGSKLVDAGVVASTKAFVKAGAENTALSRIQQGYYLLKQHMSGESAVTLITSAAAHVGRLEIRPYMQLDDVKQPGDKVAPGIYSLISKASCAELDGKSTCISTADLRKAVADADLKTLGVPDWAVDGAQHALSKDKRIEGLLAPGLYDVKPGSSAKDLITNLVTQSADAIQASGLSAQTSGPKQTPYETLIIASLIEREAITDDFPKISRVIYNRLDQKIKLGFDSTVNYVVDKPTLLTSKADREAPGPYNTYLNYGLPPTPIGVPSTAAIKAAVNPPDGDELYFVKCEKDGHSCFASTLTDHNKNIDLAKSRGVF
ncbi:endolytic transglycosylase MltG [Amycolatopsis rhabdoformis]|uniref:Endolytic murein transglycosylase n=1 Tax=Amycolatopsis rhabdoformis TaxID=1448059 RepID=A0ABZ1I9E3_9PSEU|nr:endolytic transglycosylase MltG [Amycolatopsis rhabdoformis]WSE31080.1 endolytic transglycosylase MltG [Amycolatopsis rhabdoformis]